MKRIIMFVLLFAALKVAGQTTGYLRFDTVKIMKQNGYCELYVINKTKDSLGLLTNVGGGLTQFKRPRALNDSMIIIGNDTIPVRGIGVGNGIVTVYTGDGRLTGPRRISGGPDGYSLQIDSTASISLFSGLEYISSGIGSFIQMSDSVMSIGSTSATDFSSFTFSPTRIKFTPADGAGSNGDIWTNTGSGYGHWAPGSSGSATLSNVGSGYRLVKTAGGQVKTLFVGYGLDADSSTNTNGITIKADTSELVTPSDLADAIAGAGGNPNLANVFLDSNFVPLIVFFGESNSLGAGDNSFASAGELDADPRIQIMQTSGSFQNLDIGTNNFGGNSSQHGLELELQNQIATYFNNRTVYLVKAGVSGSTIAQWQIGTDNYDTLIVRVNNAISRLNEQNKIPVICVWYLQGINDAIAGTNETTWSNSTLTLFNNFRSTYGYCPIMIGQLIGDRGTYPKFDLIDAKMIEMATDKSKYIYRIPTPQSPSGSSSTDSVRADGIHWEYLGLKAIAQRMIKAMVDTAGYINYDRRINNSMKESWKITGNSGTNITDNFIGTQDDIGLIFKTNSTERLRILNTGNIGIGVTNPSKKFEVVGDIVVNGITIGKGGGNVASNIAFGNGMINNTTGGVNIGIGTDAVGANTSGNGNIGIGYQSLAANTTASLSLAIGFQAGISSTGGGGVLLGNQVGGAWLTSQANKLVIHNGATGALVYGDMSTGQLQINSAATPALTASAALEVISTTRGFLTPIMTAAQRLAISSPATGLEVFDTDSLRKMMYTGSAWNAVAWTTDVTHVLKGALSYSWPLITNNSSSSTTLTVTGAAIGDPVLVTVSDGAGVSNGELYDAWVSGTNTVTVRQSNNSGGNITIGSRTHNVIVFKY